MTLPTPDVLVTFVTALAAYVALLHRTTSRRLSACEKDRRALWEKIAELSSRN